MRHRFTALVFTWGLAACGAGAPDFDRVSALAHDATRGEGADESSAEEEPYGALFFGYGEVSCDEPLRLSMDDDAHDEWGVRCSTSTSCGPTVSVYVISENEFGEPSIDGQKDCFAAYFDDRLEVHDLEGDGRDELFVIGDSADGTEPAELVAFAMRGGKVREIVGERPCSTGYFCGVGYRVEDLDDDGVKEVVSIKARDDGADFRGEVLSLNSWGNLALDDRFNASPRVADTVSLWTERRESLDQ